MRLICLLIGLFLSFSLWANDCFPPLNKVSMLLRAEQWVTTKTALVSVGINATVTDKGIEKIQNEVMNQLNQLSNKGEWHLVSFNRQADKAGLENVQITAQARLAQTELASLRDKAKNLTHPGETFSIDNIEFIPSDEELRLANLSLRENVYQQAKAELEALNKAYPEQKYYLHEINFNPLPVAPPGPNGLYLTKMATADASPMRQHLSIGNKQELLAHVILASMPLSNNALATNPSSKPSSSMR